MNKFCIITLNLQSEGFQVNVVVQVVLYVSASTVFIRTIHSHAKFRPRQPLQAARLERYNSGLYGTLQVASSQLVLIGKVFS